MDIKIITLFLLPFLVGISTFFIKSHNKRMVELVLAFSGAYLFSLSIIHLLPELFLHAKESEYFNLGIFILIGFFIQILLDLFSQGVEHGHMHVHEGKNILLPIFFGLSMHSIIEGLPLGLEEQVHECTHEGHHHHHHDSSSSLFYGIIIHKLPAAFILGILLSKLNISKLNRTLLIALFALMTPLGIGLANIIGESHIEWMDYVMAIVIGSFFHISTTILFESSTKAHKFSLYKITCIILGCLLALLTLNH